MAILRTAAAQTIEEVGPVWVNAVSPDGSVVVGEVANGEVRAPFRWTRESGVVRLSERGTAQAASSLGQVVIGSDGFGSCEQGFEGPYSWTWTEARGLSYLTMPADARDNSCDIAFDVSSDGSVVIGYYIADNGGYRPYRSVNESASALSLPVDPGNFTARGLSSDGSVYGVNSSTPGISSYLWKDGAYLPVPGSVVDISPDGTALVGTYQESQNGTIQTKAYRWTEAEGVTPITAPGSIRPTAVSADGAVVVGYQWDAGVPVESFIWTAEKGRRLLREALQVDHGMYLADWSLQYASDLSDDGTVLVGYDVLGGLRGWRIELCAVRPWDNGDGGDFGTAGNWFSGSVPDSTQGVLFALGDRTYQVTLDQTRSHVRLEVAEGDSLNLDLAQHTYTLTGRCGDKSLIVDSAQLVAGVDEEIGVGKRWAEVSGGGTIRTEGDTEVIGTGTPGFHVMPGNRWQQVAGTARIDGESGSESVVHVDSAEASCGGRCVFGMQAGTKGRLLVTGEGSQWSGGTLIIGSQGQGALVADAAIVQPDTLALADGPGGRSTAEVSGPGGLLWANRSFRMGTEKGGVANLRVDRFAMAGIGEGDLEVGVRGEGNLTVTTAASLASTDGASGSSGRLVLGVESGAFGRVTVDSSATLLDFTDVVVADEGNGNLRISNRASLEARNVTIAEGDGTGGLDVEALGNMRVEHDLIVGRKGVGVLSVDNGSIDSESRALIGIDGATGTVNLKNYSFGMFDFMSVGGSGDGYLAVESGSVLNGSTLVVGGSTGTTSSFAYVSGPGSALGSDRISVYETGSLRVADQGVVQARLLEMFGNRHPENRGGTLNVGTLVIGLPPTGGKKATLSEGVFADSLIVIGDHVSLLADTVIAGQAGVIGGSGLFPVPLTSAGTISPSDTSGVIGAFRLASDLTLGAESLTEIDLAGPDAFDRIEAGGVVRLGGMLSIRTVGGYAPGAGDSFEIVAGSALEGTFASVDAGALAVSVVYTDRAVRVTVDGFVGTTGVELPERVSLGSNYPNPFNPQTVIPFELPASTPVLLEVLDVAGRRVDVVVDGTLPAGRHEAVWAAGDRPSGVYLVRLWAGGAVLTRAVTLVR